MKTLATMLAELMRADAVPMSDGWGRLHDRLSKIDQTMSEIYEPVKVPTHHVHHGVVPLSSAMLTSKAMWTCGSCGTLRDGDGLRDKAAPTCNCGRIMYLGAYSAGTLPVEMPVLNYAVCNAVLIAEGKNYPRTCAVHGIHAKCPPVRLHNWVRVPGVESYEKCSGCGARSDSPVMLPTVCPGHLDF